MKNLNDELPIFEDSPDSSLPYRISVNETVGRDTHLITVVAKDRDIDDEIKWVEAENNFLKFFACIKIYCHENYYFCRYSLIGTSTNAILSIDPTKGEIKTKVDRAFDYERTPQLVIQVQAEDTLLPERTHKVPTEVTIDITDVNDEKPVMKIVGLLKYIFIEVDVL